MINLENVDQFSVFVYFILLVSYPRISAILFYMMQALVITSWIMIPLLVLFPRTTLAYLGITALTPSSTNNYVIMMASLLWAIFDIRDIQSRVKFVINKNSSFFEELNPLKKGENKCSDKDPED